MRRPKLGVAVDSAASSMRRGEKYQGRTQAGTTASGQPGIRRRPGCGPREIVESDAFGGFALKTEFPRRLYAEVGVNIFRCGDRRRGIRVCGHHGGRRRNREVALLFVFGPLLDSLIGGLVSRT